MIKMTIKEYLEKEKLKRYWEKEAQEWADFCKKRDACWNRKSNYTDEDAEDTFRYIMV